MAKHRAAVERAKWVRRWRASGQSCSRFAQQHGLSKGTLYRWAQQLDLGGSEVAAGFAEVRVVGAALGASLEVQPPRANNW